MIKFVQTFLFFIIFFFILVVFFAKQFYPLYADIFQNGMLYEGETRAKHYIKYLLYIILPTSIALGLGFSKLFVRNRN